MSELKDKLLNGKGLDEVFKKMKALVEANPTLVGTEAALEGLQVGNTKYKLPYEATANKVTSISSQSTDTQYPSAKCVYDAIGARPSATFVDWS